MERKTDKALTALKTSLSRSLQAHTGTFLYAIAWIISLAAAFAGIEPLILVGLLVVFAPLAALHWFGTKNSGVSSWQGDPLLLTSLVFAAYVFLSALWSANPQLATEKGFLILLIVFCVRFSPLLIDQMSSLQLHRCTRGIVLGLLVGMTFLVFEYITQHSILNSVAKVFPGLAKTVHGTKHIPDYHLNANVTASILFLWPALLAMWGWREKPVQKLFVAGLVIVSSYILYQTQSATAQLASIVAMLAWLAAYFVPNIINLVARGLWIIAVAGTIPIFMAMHFAGLQNTTSLPYSFRDRIHIWNYTARLVPENPVLGIGIRSARNYREQQPREIPRAHQDSIFDHQGWHSHNIFLQTWYELGAVGAALLLAIGLLLLQAIDRIEPQKRPFAYALFASFSVVAAFGYGMWQSWLLASYGWSVIFLLIGLQYADKNGMDRQSSPTTEPE